MLGIHVLHRYLDVLQARILEPLRPLPGEPEAGRHQGLVEAKLVGVRRQLLQVFTHQRLPAGEAELKHSKVTGLAEDPLPVVGRDFPLRPHQLERIRAVGAVQRAAMGQLREERRRSFGRHWINSRAARPERYSVTSALTSV
jgi:hypothetical protein